MLSAKLCSVALHNAYRKPFNATDAEHNLEGIKECQDRLARLIPI